MVGPTDQGGTKEWPERPLPKRKITEKIEIEEFVENLEEERIPLPSGSGPPHMPVGPNRLGSARERRKALIQKSKLRDGWFSLVKFERTKYGHCSPAN
jgi:hypothetical protein